jgi:hypothetical protein
MPFYSAFSRLLLVGLFTAAPVLAQDWKPIDPAHLAMKTPTVEKEADAEAIFWEVRVNDEDYDTIFNHYIRIKVFTERGKESQSTIDITYLDPTRIRDISGRTIKPDGSIVELKKDAIFERTLVRAGGLKLKAKSFAMPGVEPGAIIEYRWRESRRSRLYMRFQIQREIPVQVVRYLIKPYSYVQYGMRMITFNWNQVPVEKKEGFYGSTYLNVPGFKAEPRMPPEDQVRPWMLVFYSDEKVSDPQKFWKDFGKRIHEAVKPQMKVNDEVKQAAAAAIGDATDPEQKLQRLFDFCKTKIKNVDDDASGLVADDRDKVKENRSPSDTLKRAMGTGMDIDMLFAALAIASGFDVRLAMMPDRSDKFFDQNFPDDYFLRDYAIGVRVGVEWRFFDPARPYVPFGMLGWGQEGQKALVTDSKEPVFVPTQMSEPAKSLQKRTAKLHLREDGTLEGDVRVEYSGHLADERKEYDDDDSPNQREDTLRDAIKGRISSAELSGIKIENITDPVKPFVYSYHIKVPGYAQRTGKRLFLQPAFFQRGIGPEFGTSERKYDLYFHYPWSEDDTVEIELPEGFALDNADRPEPFNVTNVSKYDVNIGVTKDMKTLVYRRSFYFGAGGNLFFPKSSYAQLKAVFDALHDRDNHTITLKQAAVNQ